MVAKTTPICQVILQLTESFTKHSEIAVAQYESHLSLLHHMHTTVYLNYPCQLPVNLPEYSNL